MDGPNWRALKTHPENWAVPMDGWQVIFGYVKSWVRFHPFFLVESHPPDGNRYGKMFDGVKFA